MRAVVIERTGGVEVLQVRSNVDVPQPGPGQILIKNTYAGFNYIDTYIRSGVYPAGKFPCVLGRESAGVVEQVGEHVADYKLGDRVVGLHEAAYAEYTIASSTRHLAHIPDWMSDELAVACLLQGLTALALVRESYAVKQGDWLLVHAAAGGVGHILCQVIKAFGGKIIGTVSTPDKAKFARENGVNEILYYDDDIVQRVKEITGGNGVAAVFDGVGKATFDVSLEVVARKGTLVSFGNASGVVPPISVLRLAPKSIKLVRAFLYAYIETREEFEHYIDDLFKLIYDGSLKVTIHNIYDLEDVAQAHSELECRKTTAKLLLKCKIEDQ